MNHEMINRKKFEEITLMNKIESERYPTYCEWYLSDSVLLYQ